MRLLLIPICLLCSQLLFTQTQTERYADIEEEIEAYVARRAKTGLSISVAVSRRGRSEFSQQFGTADGDVYPLASVTKPITATAIRQLAEAGQLDLDAPARRYLDRDISFPDDRWREVTVRHLLNHTAGLGMYYRVLYRDEDNQVPPVRELIERYGFLFSEPGMRFEYANLGYAVLGQIVERVSGLPYGRYVRERVIAPLGRRSTGLYGDGASVTDYVSLYGVAKDSLPAVYTDTPGAGNLYGTAADLAAFGSAHLDIAPRLTKTSTVAATLADDNRRVTYADPCQPYHLGWRYQRDSLGRIPILWHDGGLDGAHSTLRLFPASGLVIAVVTNVTFTLGVADSVAAILQRALTEVAIPAGCPLPPASTFTVNEDWHGDWSGTLRTAVDSLSLKLTFQDDGNVVAAFIAPQSSIIFTGNQPFPLRILVDYVSGTTDHIYAWIPVSMVREASIGDDAHVVQLDLIRKGKVLEGAAKVFAANTGREGFGISFPVRLERSEDKASED